MPSKKRPAKKAAKKAKAPKKAKASKKADKKKTPKKKAPKKKAPKTAKTAKTPKKTGTPRKARPPRREHPESAYKPPRMYDGASARQAASATASFDDQPPQARASSFTGPGLDDGLDAAPQPQGLMGQFRRIESRVTRRFLGQSPYQEASGSMLDSIGALTRAGTYRRWVSDLMMRSRSDVVDDFGLDGVFADRWRPLFEFLYRQYWRVETAGMENVPDQGRALLVSNHSGALPYDGAMIMYAVRYDHPAHRDVRPLVEDLVFHFPYLGMFLNRIGCVRACQGNAERLLQQDRIAAVFPEGIKGISKLYRHRYQLQRFGRGGFIKLAFKTRTPIIPTSVVGAEEIHPMLTKVTWLAKYIGIPFIPITPTFPWLGPLGVLPFPSKWRIRFGEPIDLCAKYGPDAYKDRILVNKLTEQVRSTIQTMVDECLSTRRSVVFG